MGGLRIRYPDDYSNNHTDGRMFAGTSERTTTAHIWLDQYSKKKVIKLRNDETVIDEGEDTKILHE